MTAEDTQQPDAITLYAIIDNECSTRETTRKKDGPTFLATLAENLGADIVEINAHHLNKGQSICLISFPTLESRDAFQGAVKNHNIKMLDTHESVNVFFTTDNRGPEYDKISELVGNFTGAAVDTKPATRNPRENTLHTVSISVGEAGAFCNQAKDVYGLAPQSFG